MTVSVQPVQEADLPAVAKENAASKLALSINRLLWKNWPDHEKQYESCYGAVERSFKEDQSEVLKAVDDGSGEIVGFIVLTHRPAKQPKAPESEPKSNDGPPQELPDHFNPVVLTAVMSAVDKLINENATAEHIELTFMAVKQERRRQGIGSQLLSVAFERARARNLPVILQTEPAAYEFLKKHGFQDTTHHDFNLAEWTTPKSGYGLFRLQGVIWRP